MVYLPHRVEGACFFVVGVPLLCLGVLGSYWIRGFEACLFFGSFAAGGALVLATGFALLSKRVIVNERGITKGFPLGTVEFRVRWEDVECWAMAPMNQVRAISLRMKLDVTNLRFLLDEDDSLNCRAAIFKILGQSKPVVIDNSEACRPSFESFVESIRRYAKEKEVTV